MRFNICTKLVLAILLLFVRNADAQFVRLGPTGKQVTGVLGTVNGGTGLNAFATGDLLYASSTNVLSALTAGTEHTVLRMGATVPAWGALALDQAAAVTGVLPAANWSPLTTEGDLLYRDSTITTRLPRGTDTFCLRSTATTIAWASDCGTGSGTVTSVAASFTGGLVSIAGSPITTSGTLALAVAGTSGGIPYFSAATTWASSGALTLNMPVIGGGAGGSPAVGTVSGNTTAFVTTTGTQTSGDCVEIDASGNHIASGAACGGGSGANLQIFEIGDTGTNWTLPTDGKIIKVIACAGGGGGGGGSGAAAGAVRAGGGGGGGGYCAQRQFLASDLTSPVLVTVGAGGTGGPGGVAGAGTDGTVGGTTTFGSYVQAFGGGGGAGHNAGAAGGSGAGCASAGTDAVSTAAVAGGKCMLNGVTALDNSDFRGAGSVNVGTNGAAGKNSYGGGGSGPGSSSNGTAVVASVIGGSSQLSGAAGGVGGGVNAASPGTANDGTEGGSTGATTVDSGGGGAGGSSAAACAAGGDGTAGNATPDSLKPGGTGGGGGASVNDATGCAGGVGGVGGGAGGGGGGGTNTGGAGGNGGDGVVWIWTWF